MLPVLVGLYNVVLARGLTAGNSGNGGRAWSSDSVCILGPSHRGEDLAPLVLLESTPWARLVLSSPFGPGGT